MNHADLVKEANQYSSVLSGIRRELHQIPEFGLQLPKTLARVLESVHGLGEITLSENITSAVLHIKGGQPGPTVLLRADMDALAVVEDTGLDFASTNGFMHACGHDLHMSMGIGAAHLIATHKDELKGDVIIWFQPGEEGHGGADVMLEENMHLVSRQMPIAAYGIHVFSSYPKGMFGSKTGALMAAAGGMTVTFKGAGGHGSMPWLSKDPISPMAEAISALQTMVNKRFSAFDPVVINVGWVKAGDDHTENVIPEVASFGATIRTFSVSNTELVKRYATELLEGIAKAHNVEVEINFLPSTKVLMNDGKAIERVEKVIAEAFGQQRYWTMADPIAGCEDFASVVDLMPGAFVFMGACPDGTDPATASTNHSNKAMFDDSVLADGAALLAALAFETLNEAAGR
ncbi:MAG: M20 family metallopeptidase [Rhodoluna sp.]